MVTAVTVHGWLVWRKKCSRPGQPGLYLSSHLLLNFVVIANLLPVRVFLPPRCVWRSTPKTSVHRFFPAYLSMVLPYTLVLLVGTRMPIRNSNAVKSFCEVPAAPSPCTPPLSPGPGLQGTLCSLSLIISSNVQPNCHWNLSSKRQGQTIIHNFRLSCTVFINNNKMHGFIQPQIAAQNLAWIIKT